MSIPVFHPNHPHNRPQYPIPTPLAPGYDTNIPRMPSASARSRNPSAAPPSSYKSPGGMSDSDASVGSSPSNRRCFCGREVVDGGIYCSIDCARSDAFTSLCYKPGGPSTSGPIPTHPPSLGSAMPTPSAESTDGPDWNASHYRRMARADSRRDERREERRRRRAEGSIASSAITSRSATLSTVSSSSSRVPDLVGGYTHSRNASTASTASSVSGWSGSTLSRNPSSASNISSASRRYRGDAVGVIQEDDDEEEYLDTRPYPLPGRGAGGMGMSLSGMGGGALGGHKKSRSGHTKRKGAEPPMGMGKDMRDILEEIISMEKSFSLEDEIILGEDSAVDTPVPAPGLFTAVFDKPPRTPSPISHRRTRSVAPDAPLRGTHRASMSLSQHPSGLAPPPNPQRHSRSRPSSLMGLHQSSLSESHTALYLATASPVAPSRRSASPKLRSRNSLSFTPESAGPAINLSAARFGGGGIDSPASASALTPSARRRPQVSPSAAYAPMEGWRFPGSTSGFGGTTTPRGPQQPSQPIAQPALLPEHSLPPHLLWPPHPQSLSQSQSQPTFPTSPGADTPTFLAPLSRPGQNINFTPGALTGPGDFTPPPSGLRLGVLLGSGDEMEVDDEDDGSTAHGHGHGQPMGAREYLPVFLEAEGFRGRQWAS
ncbi:uncharacterized protein MKK02DRAFT_37701 [Dioszegia hungarica]|uniref:Uncharacterized protein n=1 Tax=Dioszegia hungarica TaxID=4972 RepID=A0AA38H8Z7_9TREE|nr:uncharacterized protein MKK02DRAFT_37701 [Dioszegia hungarica]KAI9634826.1 hypothetical protein MKK02DRAFT_37701 [Dioszegia hungarica]